MQFTKQYLDEIEQFEKNPKSLKKYIKDVESQLFETEWFKERPENIKEVFRKYSVFGFYRAIDLDNKPCRITGFHETKDGKIVAQTHIPMLGMGIFNSTIGGRSLDKIEKVDNWSEEDYKKMAFLDPTVIKILKHPMGIQLLLTE